jgi:hypothetical protein
MSSDHGQPAAREYVELVPTPEGWRPPAEAARAILRVVMAVRERQRERRESAA